MNDFNNLMNRLNMSNNDNNNNKKTIIIASIIILLIIGISVFYFITSNNKKKLNDKNNKEKIEIIKKEDKKEEEPENSGVIENSELEIVLNENTEESKKETTDENNTEEKTPKEEENKETPKEETTNEQNNNSNNDKETIPVTYGFNYPSDIMTLELENDHFKGTYKDNSAYFYLTIYFNSNMKEVISNNTLLREQLINKYNNLEVEESYNDKIINNKNWYIINGKHNNEYFSSGYTIFKQGIAAVDIFSQKDNIENIYKDINLILNSGTKKEK